MPCLETVMGESIDTDMDAFVAMQPHLEREHPHEVAILQDGKLLATGKDYDEALDRALAHPERRKDLSMFISQVGPYDEDQICIFSGQAGS